MTIAPSTFEYAQKLLHKGYGFQNAARIAGMNEADLRQLAGACSRRESKPVPQRPTRAAEPALCSNETMAIIDRVARDRGLTRRDILGACQSRRLTPARHEAMALVHEARPHLSFPALGRIFGGRDHTTIMNGVARHHARMAWAEFLIAAGRMDGQLELFARAA